MLLALLDPYDQGIMFHTNSRRYNTWHTIKMFGEKKVKYIQMPSLGIEPRFTRPQRVVLTPILTQPLLCRNRTCRTLCFQRCTTKQGSWFFSCRSLYRACVVIWPFWRFSSSKVLLMISYHWRLFLHIYSFENRC